jgi:hypothetical protein
MREIDENEMQLIRNMENDEEKDREKVQHMETLKTSKLAELIRVKK